MTDPYDLGKTGWRVLDLPGAIEDRSELDRFLERAAPSRVETTMLDVDPARALLAASGRAMSLHTDNTYLDVPCRYVGLYCVAPDDGGRSVLVDGRAAIAGMDQADRAQLGTRAWYWRNGRSGGTSGPHRVIEPEGRVRWWRTNLCVADEALLGTAERLEQCLNRSPDLVTLALSRGQLLLVDNERILHGRTPVQGNDRRMLRIRVWTPR